MRKREQLARFGIGTKGFVYCLLSGLAVMAAFGSGGETTGREGILQYLAEQSFGNILLWITAVGLFAFSLWRLYRAFLEEHDDDSTGKEAIRRGAYGLSALVYGSLGYTAVQVAKNEGSADEGSWMQTILEMSYGKTLLIIVGLIIFGKAVYEIYRAFSGQYREEIDHAAISTDVRDTLIQTGKVGHAARGIVIGIIAYLTVRAALSYDASSANAGEAFSFIQSNFGPVVMGIIALGLFCYGVFQFVRAKYEPLSI